MYIPEKNPVVELIKRSFSLSGNKNCDNKQDIDFMTLIRQVYNNYKLTGTEPSFTRRILLKEQGIENDILDNKELLYQKLIDYYNENLEDYLVENLRGNVYIPKLVRLLRLNRDNYEPCVTNVRFPYGTFIEDWKHINDLLNDDLATYKMFGSDYKLYKILDMIYKNTPNLDMSKTETEKSEYWKQFKTKELSLFVDIENVEAQKVIGLIKSMFSENPQLKVYLIGEPYYINWNKLSSLFPRLRFKIIQPENKVIKNSSDIIILAKLIKDYYSKTEEKCKNTQYFIFSDDTDFDLSQKVLEGIPIIVIKSEDNIEYDNKIGYDQVVFNKFKEIRIIR